MTMTRASRRLVWIALALAGCSRQLMPTPNLYIDAQADPFADVPPAQRTADVDMLYVTDRVPEPRRGSMRYGVGRSPSMAWGSCVVGIGRDLTWEQLVDNSRKRHRDVSLPLSLQSITEVERFPETPDPSQAEPADERAAEAEFLNELKRRLALTPRKEAFVFVHGYHDSFEAAAFVAAELWHFLGRQGVPIVYTWPAGHGGLLQGYDYDRESGLFSVYHLKGFLELLATCPQLESVSIIAHSRGTSVVVDALGDLIIAARAAGREPREAYKLHRLVLAAADIDVMVATQRIAAERIGADTGPATIYISQHDMALGISDWLFSDRRLGNLEYDELTDFERAVVADSPGLTIVDARVPKQGWGHSYFHTSPAVSSDLILLLRDDLEPGRGRPLTNVGPNYWELDKDYPGTQPDE